MVFLVSPEKTEIMKTIFVDAVGTLVIEGEGVFEEMHELLETYPNKKIILTGANDEQYKAFGLHIMPYDVFTLKHNPEKIDPRYYEIVLAEFSLSNDDVVYFEHNPEAVVSAQTAGIITYLYDSDERDLNKLRIFLDNNL